MKDDNIVLTIFTFFVGALMTLGAIALFKPPFLVPDPVEVEVFVGGGYDFNVDNWVFDFIEEGVVDPSTRLVSVMPSAAYFILRDDVAEWCEYYYINMDTDDFRILATNECDFDGTGLDTSTEPDEELEIPDTP